MKKRSNHRFSLHCFLPKKPQKAQLKIQQMAFMLIAVTIFFFLVGIIILAFSLSGLKQTAETLEEENAMLLAAKLGNSPEFSCGESLGNFKINCIDSDKFMMLIERKEKYSNFWGGGISNIEIRKIYPEQEESVCNQINYPNCNIMRLYPETKGYSMSSFVSLCRKESFEGEVYNKCELAKLLVSYDENE